MRHNRREINLLLPLSELCVMDKSFQGHSGTSRMATFLFVGAPFGPFFRTLAHEVERRGGKVWRVVSHGGEVLDTPRRCRIFYRGGRDNWPTFVRQTLFKRGIDAVVTFNDTLPRNRAALQVAELLGRHSFVLENGYLRPHWVTLERDGVNGFSRLPRDPSAYLDPVFRDAEQELHQNFEARLRPHVKNAIRHFAAAVAAAPLLGFDARYYGHSVFRQAAGYVGEYAWRLTHDERGKLDAVTALREQGRKVFLCLMQKPGDGQLVVHSRHGGNEAFLKEVLTSFGAHAPNEAILVIKQHPLDYAIERSFAVAERTARELGIEKRVFYLRKTSIDRIMPLAFGVLTINSTGGLATIIEEKPVICLGRSFYAIEGLTFQGPVDAFWTEAERPDPMLVRGFVAFLKATSQINGGFHTRQALALLTPRLAERLVEGAARSVVSKAEAKAQSYAERHVRLPSLAVPH